jgi:hypothetical protein
MPDAPHLNLLEDEGFVRIKKVASDAVRPERRHRHVVGPRLRDMQENAPPKRGSQMDYEASHRDATATYRDRRPVVYIAGLGGAHHAYSSQKP